MNKEYKIKLDLNKKLYNKKMAFNQFDENVNDFYIEVTKNNEVVKDLDKSIITLVAIKPNNAVDAQFIEVKEGQIYADLKPSMCDLVGNYQAKAMIVLEGEIVTTDTINYSVNEDKIISRLNEDVVSDERFTLFTDALARLSDIEASEEQRIVNEAERILSEENRKIEEAKRVEAELIRQHEEADRAKYDATRESNENIRKQNESIRLANETNRIDEEAKRVEEENKRKLAEEERNANYNFMTEDEERRRLEANAHKEAEVLRAQAEITRVNEEAKRRTTEQARVSAENTRVSNENIRKTNEETRQTNETHRVEAETQRQNRYNSFILEAEANASNFENYTNSAKVKEEERKSNELDRKSQEAKRVSNEVERISNENTRKANEKARERNETSRQYVFENKVDEVDKKIIEINTTKDNFISSINTKVDTKISEIDNTKDNFVSSVNTKVDNKISELDNAKSDMANTVSNKVNEVETRFNALTSKQQQDAEVIDARDGETSLKARLDRDIEKAKQVYVNVEGSHISTDSSSGYAKDVEILGNTIQDASNLADIRSVGDKVEGQELYEIPVLSCGKNVWNVPISLFNNNKYIQTSNYSKKPGISLPQNSSWTLTFEKKSSDARLYVWKGDVLSRIIGFSWASLSQTFTLVDNEDGISFYAGNFGSSPYDNVTVDFKIQLEEGTIATPYEPYQEDKLTILSLVQLEKVGDVRDRIVCKDGVWGVEKNVITKLFDGSENNVTGVSLDGNGLNYRLCYSRKKVLDNVADSSKLMSNKFECFVYSSSTNNVTVPSFRFIYTNSELYCVVPATEFTEHPSTQAFKEKVASYGTYIKYPTTQPQFIPLPHDQQVKLRTFANKTNISFGCEIEGTIKAQVPKSLGATVNTHTEQINNLNKELDRVKKLEESTVSTVTTESDFTTVEATSNGYFEDVKLEGKTLVNHIDFATKLSANNFAISGGIVTLTNNGSWGSVRLPIPATLKTNTKYTIILNVLENTTGAKFYYLDNNVSTSVFKSSVYLGTNSNGIITQLVETVDDFSERNIGMRTDSAVGYVKFTYMLLEGDHTKNSPSYFEGLKSVGDVVDEVSVESVKGDGNLFDATLDTQTKNGVTFSYDGATGEIVLNGTCTENNTCVMFKYPAKFIEGNTYYLRIFGTTINSPLAHIRVYDDNYVGNNLATTSRGTSIHKSSSTRKMVNTSIRVDSGITFNNFRFKVQLIVNEDRAEYIPQQSDKKRLLYYNEETQTWEKPILRQGDSIEKHANGKYYYHQRSGEIVFNGSENWNNDKNSSTMSPETYRQSIQFNAIDIPNAAFNTKTSPNIISDLLPTVIFGDVYSYNHIGVSISGTDSMGTHIIINNNFTDVAELKQWLQANNLTVVYELAQEKVYECTNIDLITYNGETNFIVESGVLSPKTTLKVHNNISNVVSLLQKKVSILESNITSYMITQNRLMLASRYNADTVSFKVDVASFSDTFEYDNDLYELILNNILVGKDNYNREYIENLIRFYWMDFVISDEMYSTLFEIIEEQHNPKIEEAPLI